jgi:hypothetical protein
MPTWFPAHSGFSSAPDSGRLMRLRLDPTSEDLYLFLYIHNFILQSVLPSFNPSDICLAQLDGDIYSGGATSGG